ncbi:CD276 antigen-like isoform X2, partial [Lates japonicus]
LPSAEEKTANVSEPHFKAVAGAAVNSACHHTQSHTDWRTQQVVRGAPQTEVEWQDLFRDRILTAQLQVFDRDGRYDIIVQTTVTKTDIYRCVATQKEISHQTHAWTYVFICGTEVIVLEGSDVTLPCSLSTRENIGLKRFEWWKDGGREVFLYESGQHSNKGLSGQDEKFKGRVSHFEDELKNGNASITIRDSKLTDSGNYTCEFPVLKETSHIQLVVGTEIIVLEGSDVTLPCSLSTRENIGLKRFVWWKDGGREVFLYESGQHSNKDGPLKDRRGENIPGAAPEPSVTSLQTTKDWSLLQCVVRGASPKPEVVWQDSSGHNLTAKEQVTDRGGRYDVTLHTTVTKTGNYTCVATQEEINHWTAAWIHVYISGGTSMTEIIAWSLVGVLCLVVVLAVILCRRRKLVLVPPGAAVAKTTVSPPYLQAPLHPGSSGKVYLYFTLELSVRKVHHETKGRTLQEGEK